MARISELYFNLYHCEYRLTFYKNENPKLYKEGKEYIGNKSEVLRDYIVELGFGNTLFKKQTPQQLSIFILNHFSDKPNKDKDQTKTISNNKSQLKMETPKIKINQEKLHLSENFKVVMICSKRKNKSRFKDYPNINFKADPEKSNEYHPDDLIPNSNKTWREYLEEVESQKDDNLLMAYQLYTRKEYQNLFQKFNKSFYILSAGWGLVSSEFKLPNYDITFSSTANSENKRTQNITEQTNYKDFNQLNIIDNEDIIFIGSPNYIHLFIQLTKNLTNKKIIYWKNQKLKIDAPNNTFEYRYFNTNTKTNWHYELANNISNGIIP
jgi:hypothetical protein